MKFPKPLDLEGAEVMEGEFHLSGVLVSFIAATALILGLILWS
jgi:hypothetical protein